ncbi:MAG: hypothetical protein N2747_01135 [Chitinophagaceae bacterium]|nr:hypothetical protein [Chitinophagaceae bacterium]
MIRFFISLLLLCGGISAAQKITPADLKKLRAIEDTLKEYARYMITDSLTEDRMISDSIFTRTLVRALRIKNSFYYPFDSVLGISRLYAPDSAFRIFTWNLLIDEYYCRQKGAIQMRTPDGSLKLFPLFDVSEFTENPHDSARSHLNWIGAVYYNIIKTSYRGKNYYTLFGIDPNNLKSAKKWMEVLYFNEKNQPVFGGPFFSYEKDSVPGGVKYRIGLEYKKQARALMNYFPDLKMILMDHLVSETDQPELPWTLVPDGDQEGFVWENGKWVHVDKVFTFKLQDGQAPVADPVFDAKGNYNEQKLQQKSELNKQKEKGKNNNN